MLPPEEARREAAGFIAGAAMCVALGQELGVELQRCAAAADIAQPIAVCEHGEPLPWQELD